ncbi:hypothetical protein [Nocardioides ferulae]|uniref:hypothetical protein n=1 Tax=Nocardioides ferulae TaxID=2340821 RepID=UPI000EB0D9EC|nr:hypothetical protein [Nocardioides ferulae]
MLGWIVVGVSAAGTAAYLGYDWMKSSQLKKRLASGQQPAPGEPFDRTVDTNTNYDVMRAQSNSVRNQTSGL